MPTKKQEREAWAIAVELHRMGIKSELQGEWLVLKPPPPPSLLMRIMDLPDGLVTSVLPKVIAASPLPDQHSISGEKR